MKHVIEGLKNGKSFRRLFGIDGIEIVRPIGQDTFEHSVSHNGSGGVGEFSLETLSNGRWGTGWQEM